MIGTVFLALGLVILAAHLGAAALYLARLRQRAPEQGLIGQPFVTLLRPVCGVDAFDAETLRSSFAQDYPQYEIIFCAPAEADPAVALVRRLMAEHPGVRARLLVGLDRITTNPKLNNVWKGWQAAAGDWVCMTDSNLLLPPDYLSRVVAAWGPATGLVSSPPTGTRPMNLGGRLECAFLNSNQALLQHAVASLGPAFAQGKTLFFNKPLLEHAGGLRALGASLAEDVAATKAIRAMGREVTLTHLPFAQPIGKRSLAQVWDRQLRWSRVRRDGFAGLFAAEILNGSVVPTLMVTAGLALTGGDLALIAGFLGLWYLAEVLVAKAAGWPIGPRDVPALLLRDLLIPAIWGATFLRRGFEWRGTPMGSEDQGRGRASPAPQAHPVPAE